MGACFRGLISFLVAGSILAGLGPGGCGRAPDVRTRGAEPILPIPGFLGMKEDTAAADTTPIRGRRIVLDPGHGGRFRGAFGPNGLAEADVNLGVALSLRSLLEAAGARVFMTRTTDRDFTAADDSSLAKDLDFRIAFTDSIQPDVFLSLHHNSNPTQDPTINATQTYYPLGEGGAAADLARAIHRHLAVNLEISPAQLLPGNFAVLRRATVPAVLGEPAMISHPVMAERLTLPQSQRLEAEAYFLGLVEYFTLGVPGWSGAAVDTVILDPGDPGAVVSWAFLPDRTAVPAGAGSAGGGPGPDPSSFRLRADDQDVPYDLSPDGRSVSWRPNLLPRPLLLELSGRSLTGQATAPRRTLVVPAGQAPVLVRVIREAGTPARLQAAVVHWRTSSGLSAIAGKLSWSNGFQIELANAPEGWHFVPEGAAVPPAEQPLLVVAAERTLRGADGSPAAAPQPCPAQEDSLPPGWAWRSLEGDAGTSSLITGTAWRRRLGPDTAAVPAPGRLGSGASILCVPVGQPIWIEGAGLLPLVDPAPGNAACPRTVEAQAPRWSLAPVLPEIAGRIIVLDPLGGGVQTDGTGPLGTRGSDLNLAAARAAAALLRGAGATVLLTREGDFPLTDQDKVLLAKQAGADFFLGIGRSGRPDSLGLSHFPGSTAGTRWAQRMAPQVAPLLFVSESAEEADGLPGPTVGPGQEYLLRHTHCPALILRLPAAATAQDELVLSSAARARAEAAAILLGIAAWLAADTGPLPTVDLAELIGGLPGGLPPVAVDLAVWDGYAVWTPLSGKTPADSLSSNQPAGAAALTLPARGPVHVLEIHADNRWQLWRLERADQRWDSRLMLEKR